MLRHTPYDGSSKLFRIGLGPLDPAEWIDVDDRLHAYLDEKQLLWRERPDEVFAAEAGTEAAQAEVLALLLAHLPARFPGRYRRDGDAMHIAPGRVVPLADGAPPLWTAARLVQEDLVLMRRAPAGWRLAAASLSFPSSWALADKIGRPIDEVHAPVPGFGGGTRNAELIARMFDNLRPETPMLRWNWSLYGDERLFHPETADAGARRFGVGERADPVVLRSERQTLRRLPESGDIVFTIRIAVEPLATLERHSRRHEIAAALIAQIEALRPDELAYKGLSAERGRVLARLGELLLP
ncbi:MAG: hypothetical protein BGO82_07135 [Devosia sp. 67-54]|uniref:heme-dependent oxidative N-demethylase family protein n=1 Tax=unclassified Devosia TaxID=196773 RepID=UPI00095F6139|nr:MULTISPECIES: DUF3445 domain-containing protein [unclassified Devosia]MBN9307089.1 DUF3445 domain-containing protein [Devosia sp.]OJX19495.1 MAG: hypothetical protein BGO82_07135 [Devosia sp. 67-54]